MKKLFEGSGVALVTPFKDGKVNYEKLGELIEWHIANKTDSIIVCGTTGESATMTDEERKTTIKFVVDKVLVALEITPVAPFELRYIFTS